jgi:hypothetical protein
MKAKTFLITAIALFLIFGINGCDKDKNDDDICEFNVDDPINDLEWLKSIISSRTASLDHSFAYDLYQNKKTSNKYYFIETYVNSEIIEYSRQNIYNCKGDMIMLKGIEGPEPDGWEDFFENNEKIKRIWPNK